MTVPMQRVCVYCASSDGVRPEYIAAARDLGTLLATRDLALVVKQAVAAQDLLDAFRAEIAVNPSDNIVQAIVLFDEYRGKGLEADEKSLAFRFGLQDTQNTLQDDQVEALMTALAGAAREKHHAKLRG